MRRKTHPGAVALARFAQRLSRHASWIYSPTASSISRLGDPDHSSAATTTLVSTTRRIALGATDDRKDCARKARDTILTWLTKLV